MSIPSTETGSLQTQQEIPPSLENEPSEQPSYLDYIGITDNPYLTAREKKFMRWVSRNTGVQVEESKVLNSKTGQEESEGAYLALKDPLLRSKMDALMRPNIPGTDVQTRLNFNEVIDVLYLRKHGIDEEKKGIRKALKKIGKLIKNNMLSIVDGAVDIFSGDFLSRGIQGEGHCLDWAVTVATIVHMNDYTDVPPATFEVVPYDNERPEGQNYSPLLGHDHYGIRYIQNGTEMMGIYPGVTAPVQVIREDRIEAYFAARDAQTLGTPEQAETILEQNRAIYEKMAVSLRNIQRSYETYNQVKNASSLHEIANGNNL